jgi:pilus assembly protein CpaE
MSDLSKIQNGTGKVALSVALFGPNEQRRSAMAASLSGHPGVTVKEFSSFPFDLSDLPRFFEKKFDVVLVDVDSDPDLAFSFAETISNRGLALVMAFTAQADVKQAIRFMRAGVREFFTLPVDRAEMGEALTRAWTRMPKTQTANRAEGKVFVFLGTKGGCGVTTLASNFAVTLAQESSQSTLLIDLGLPLGDVAITLGMTAEFSIDNALHDSSRLDGRFLQSLLAIHDSGLSLLAAPNEFSSEPPGNEAINKLLAVARENFDYVVIDVGSRVDLLDTAIFEVFSTVYLITQAGVSELRNSNRMISRFFVKRGDNLQIVLNRYKPSTLLFDDKYIEKALTREVQWKVPDDYAAARRTQATATPLAMMDSPISNVIRQMARTAAGLPEKEEKKGLFSFFR